MKKYDYVFLIPSLRSGGAERNCIRLANAFIRRGANVSIWVRELSPNDLRGTLHPNVDLVVIGGRGVLSTSKNLIKQLWSSNIKSILAFNYFWLGPALLTKFFSRKKTKISFRIISSLKMQLSKNDSFTKRMIGLFYLKFLARFSDTIIAQCDAMKIESSRFINVSPKRMVTIYNPVESSTQQGFEPRNHEVLYVGRLIPLKGLVHLLNAFAKLSQRDSRVVLRLVGDGPQMSELNALVEKLGLKNKVMFDGYQSDVSTYYKKAKVTVLTSLYEGFPNVLVESISHGTPIVAFDCKTGPSEIVVENVNGHLVRYLDVDELCEKLYLALNVDTFNVSDIVATAYKFDLETIVDQYLKSIT